MMITKTPITVAAGDGVGPEIMDATLKILEAANAAILPEFIEIGEKVYLKDIPYGITLEGFESLRKNKIFLKGPVFKQNEGNYHSLNIAIRKVLGVYANVRSCVARSPYVPTHHPDMDVVIVREISEDLYVGIEHRQTNDCYQALKFITREGCERVIKFAFEYARQFHRKKVTCLSKDNVLIMTDGLFHKIFNEISMQYSDIESEHYLLGSGVAQIADNPEQFDVVVAENVYGDIISDIVAELVGSVDLGGSSNIGTDIAMFDANHGPCLDIAGYRIANPSGMINASVQMLIHLNQLDTAALIENAWIKTIEDGIHTPDIYSTDYSEKKVSTDEFADAVIERLGEKPTQFKSADYSEMIPAKNIQLSDHCIQRQNKQLVGIDVYIDLPLCGPTAIAEKLLTIDSELKLSFISNRGVTIWENEFVLSQKYCADHWECRFVGSKDLKKEVSFDDIISLLQQIKSLSFDIIKTENLYTFDGERCFE